MTQHRDAPVLATTGSRLQCGDSVPNNSVRSLTLAMSRNAFLFVFIFFRLLGIIILLLLLFRLLLFYLLIINVIFFYSLFSLICIIIIIIIIIITTIITHILWNLKVHYYANQSSFHEPIK
jgi:hypothetical protein